jgi:hypothetical protein
MYLRARTRTWSYRLNRTTSPAFTSTRFSLRMIFLREARSVRYFASLIIR